MEKWYLIYAYEHRYEGYFGVSDWAILWTTPQGAREEAEHLSRKVIRENGVDVFFHDEHLEYEDGVQWAMAYQVWELDNVTPALYDMDPTAIIEQNGVHCVWER